MSTVPRVSSAIPDRPTDLRGALAHCPDLAAAFHRLYATLWQDGIVSQRLKETARMRNARVTDCGFCRNVRFDGARTAGLDEASIDHIADGFDRSERLDDDQKAVLRFTDAYLRAPAEVPAAVREEMAARFSPAEIVELTTALALFLGMAKVLVSLGLEPEDMPLTVLPTPGTPR